MKLESFDSIGKYRKFEAMRIKRKYVLTVLSAAVAMTIISLFFKHEMPGEAEQPQVLEEMLKTVAAPIPSQSNTRENEEEAKVAEELIRTAIEAPDTKPEEKDDRYDEILAIFPVLKTEIQAFRTQVEAERTKLKKYQTLAEQRNELVRAGQPITDEMNTTLDTQREELLERSKELGLEAMKINERIRELAADRLASE